MSNISRLWTSKKWPKRSIKIKTLNIEIQTALQGLIDKFDTVDKGTRQFERAIRMSQVKMKRDKIVDIHELWNNNTRYTYIDSIEVLKYYWSYTTTLTNEN